MKRLIPTGVAIFFGGITLLGYLIIPQIGMHRLFVQWAATLAAVAFLLGIVNLLGVHINRIAKQERDWPYSIFLILAALMVILIALFEGQGPAGPAVSWVFHAILSPLEAAASALLVFFLAGAAFRVMRKRPSIPTLVFVLTIFLVLLAALPFVGETGVVLGGVRTWLVRVFATAGARGMLLGVTLGTIATGVRVLVGIDRPHSEREP